MKKIKLHLGCGDVYIPGFIHIDSAFYPHLDYQHDITDLSMFKDNSVDLIYCCHAFEYLDRKSGREALFEWFRVLNDGGILRLAVPDFQSIVLVYEKYKDIDHRGILGPLFGKIETLLNGKMMYHKTAYDYKSLKKMLESAGFRSIRRWDWRKTEHSQYDDYSQAYIPHMDKEKGLLMSLNLEAEKINIV